MVAGEQSRYEECKKQIHDTVRQRIDLSREVTDAEIQDMIDDLIVGLGRKYALSLNERQELGKSVFYAIRKMDVLQELIDCDEVTEIMINGTENIFIEKSGHIYEWDKHFDTREKLENVIQQIVAKCNRVVNEASPIVDARLENGSRVNIVLAPVALNGPIVTIRRFPNHPISMEDLLRFGSITKQASDELEKLVIAGYNIFISGGTGSGKTTFLNLLLDKYEYSGKIISSVEFDYFPYPVKEKDKLTMDILSEVCPFAEEWEIYRELSHLEVDGDVLFRAFETLSNGEQTKVLLAALFLNEGHFLLIDEPTNHLDIRARELVAKYLNSKKGFILVSHDRRFLDGCVDHILSMNKNNIEIQSGNYSSFSQNFERRQASEAAENERLKKDIKRLKTAARRTDEWSGRVEKSKTGAYDKGFVGHKAAKMMKRSKAIENRQNRAVEQKSMLLKNAERADALKMFPLMYHSSRLVSVSQVSISYDCKAV